MMDFNAAGYWRRTTEKSVVGVAGIGQFKISAPDLGPGGRRTRPRMTDLKVSSTIVVGYSWRSYDDKSSRRGNMKGKRGTDRTFFARV